MQPTAVDRDEWCTLTSDSGGGAPRGCAWDETVCTERPDFRIVLGSQGAPPEQAEALLFCARHYVTELARLVEVHLPGCSQPANAHVLAFGSISD